MEPPYIQKKYQRADNTASLAAARGSGLQFKLRLAEFTFGTNRSTATMPLSPEDIQRIASLSKLSFSAQESADLLDKINRFFELVEQMDSVDTAGVEPLFHPVSAVQDIALRLQDDIASTADGTAQREANMQNAPAAEAGFFLVPKVIE